MAYKHITIPCKTYIKKYIAARYGELLKVDNYTLIGIYVYALIEKERFDYHLQKLDNDFLAKHYNDKMQLLISDFLFFRIGFDLSPDRVASVNRLMEEMMEEHLFMWCDAYVRNGKERTEAINDFADAHNIDIEIDITFESLKKSEYRLRKKKEKLSQPTPKDIFTRR